MKATRFNVNLVIRSVAAATPLVFAISMGAQATPTDFESRSTSNVVQRGSGPSHDMAAEDHNGLQPRRPENSAVPEQAIDTRTAAAAAYTDAWSAEVKYLGDE